MVWSRLQAAGNATAAAATIAKAYTTANLTAGSKLIAWVALNATAAAPSTTSVDDGNGNTFALMGSQGLTASGAFLNLSCWELDTPAGDVGTKPTITAHCTNTGSSAGLSITIQEVSGLATGTTTAILDGGAIAFFTNAALGGTTVNVPTYSSTVVNEFLEQCYSDWGSGDTVAVPTGYTGPDGIEASNDSICILGYKNSTNGSETGTWTGTSNTTAIILGAVAFKLLSIANGSATPAVLTATVVLPAPAITIAGPASVSIPPLAATAVLPAPTAGTGGISSASVSVAAVAARAQLPAPAIGAGISVTVSVPAVAAAAQMPVALASPLFSADPVAATTQLPGPVITGKISVTVSILAVMATTVLPAPTVTFGTAGDTPVPVPPLVATTVLPAPAVAAGATVPVPALAATTQLPVPTIFAGFVVPASLTPPALAATTQLPAPLITIGSGVLLPLLAVTVQLPVPAVVTVDVALPVVAYLFTPPVSNYVPPVPADRDGHNDPGWRLMKYHHPTSRGVNVFKLSDGTYPRDDVTGVWPTTPTVPNDALSSVWGVGSLSPIITPIDPEVIYVYYGGHSYLVDDAEAGRLTAAGYGSDLVGVNQDQIDVMTAQGWGFDTSGVLV